jgi:hydroxymethylglutaryl-CoA lyase
LKRTPDEAVAELAAIAAARDRHADDTGHRVKLEVGISTAFGCTLQGRVNRGDGNVYVNVLSFSYVLLSQT